MSKGVGNKGLSKVGNKGCQNLFTPHTISTGNPEPKITTIRKNILKELKNSGSNFSVRGCAEALNCDHKNISYHLKYLEKFELVQKTAKMGVWKITNKGLQLFSRVGNKGLSSGEEKVVTKGCFSEYNIPQEQQITETEKEILDLFTREFLTPKQIADKRKTSKEAVNKVLRRLRKKGILSKISKRSLVGNKGLSKSTHTTQPLPHNPQYIRLHAMQYRIKILHKYNNFKGTEQITIDDNIIKVWNNVIEIYSNEGLSFIGIDSQSATNKAMFYWNKFFRKVENRLNIEILKDGYSNIELVKAEYEEVHNEVAKRLKDESKKLRLYTKEGKLWGYIDYSFNNDCFETCKKDSSKPDMEKVAEVFNDIRDNSGKIFLPSEITQTIGELTSNFNRLQEQIMELGSAQQNLIKMMTPKQKQNIEDKHQYGNYLQ